MINYACSQPHDKFPIDTHFHGDACCVAQKCDPVWVIGIGIFYAAAIVFLVLTILALTAIMTIAQEVLK